MDLYKSIRELYEQKKRLDVVIASLEELEKSATEAPKRRGRKPMGPQARREVSERMRQYWARRRKEQQSPSPAAR
jgi:hypothetical protein